MIANSVSYPRQTVVAGPSLMARAVFRVGQMFCGLRGHESVLHFEGKRVMMRCTSCGYDSPGWEVSGRAPRQRFEGDKRHVMASPRVLLRAK